MPSGTDREITQILAELDSDSHDSAVERLLPLVYAELRALSGAYLERERPDHTLQATALVHEAYLRLAGRSGRRWADRAHFFRAAAKTMRHILINHAHKHRAARRGGGARGLVLEESMAIAPRRPGADLEALDEALVRLASIDREKAQVVELRFFAGCTIDETAEALDLSTATVERHWRFARAWLRSELTR
jgi:RNA polymerase sigma factor (TIGR02999 family)